MYVWGNTRLIRRFALHNLCDLNSTSWASLVAQLVRATTLKAGSRGFESHLSSLFLIEKRALRFVAFKSLSSHVRTSVLPRPFLYIGPISLYISRCMGRYTFTGLNEYVHACRPNYNGLSLDKSLDISTHCSSTCRADLTKWPDESAPVVLAIVKRDTKKSQANTK